MSIIRLTLLALVACVPLLAQAAPYQLTTAWPVNVGPLNPHLYTPNQMFAQSMVYEPLVKYQADGSVQPWLATPLASLRRRKNLVVHPARLMWPSQRRTV
ncbi:hypothetical protein LNQ03_19310 [Klebsiella pneumoniae subsp. pneumoniae]|nr:hypothetical protein [Klebsiella pneumoniae subsp. pneumoniae]